MLIGHTIYLFPNICFQLRSRDDLIDKLGLVNERLGERHGSHAFDKVPLLSEVLRLSKVTILKSETPSPTDISHRQAIIYYSMNDRTMPWLMQESQALFIESKCDHYRTEEESSLRSSAIDETGTAKSSLTLGLGARNSNAYGMNNINQGLYGLSDRSTPGSIATTPPQSLTPERYKCTLFRYLNFSNNRLVIMCIDQDLLIKSFLAH